MAFTGIMPCCCLIRVVVITTTKPETGGFLTVLIHDFAPNNTQVPENQTNVDALDQP